MTSDSSKAVTYPVWVGSLAGSVNDNILMSHFKKFGPVRSVIVMRDPATGKSKQFGYVNYHNHEVAEVAAQEMNGVDICGKKIKTKGPKKLTKNEEDTVQSPPISPTGKKNLKRFMTDCYYFTQHGHCIPKAGQVCQYRHFEKARNTKLICEKWIAKSCTKKYCSKQHPSQKQDQSTVTLAVEKDQSQVKQENNSKTSFSRCSSHNAFKCYGECGKMECGTHFQEEKDLMDHVKEGKVLYSPCKVCNAVFFDKEEKRNHIHIAGSVPSSSSSTSSCSDSEPIGVFWDIENCCVPKGISPIAIVNKIREKFYPGRREVEFMCVCDTTKEKKEILEELNKAQINIVHINATSKNAADDKLKQALRRFAQAHMPPATVVLVSGDINFASELSDLRHRHNLRVILLHNKQASEAILQCAHECERFDLFTTGLPSPVSTFLTQPDAINEVIISNLPAGDKYPVQRIKGRLNTLTSNTGGKVINISTVDDASVAVLKFSDADSARRAIQRLNKEVIYESEIKACLKPKQTKEKSNNAQQRTKPNAVYSNLKKTASKSTPNMSKINVQQKHFPNNNTLLNETKLNSPINGNITMALIKDNVPHPDKQNKNKQNTKDISKNLLAYPYTTSNLVQVNQKVFSNSSYLTGWSQTNNLIIQNNLQNNMSNLQNGLANGVDLLVTNLDKNVSIKDIKKKLSSLIREHSKVTSVIIAGRGKENNLHAFIKVPRLQDAQLCILKINNQLLFNRRIRVSLASAKENALLKMKSDVSAILLDTYAGWLPVNDFLLVYKERYQQAFHVLNLDKMKDLVYVDGRPGFQFICLLHFPVGLLKVGKEVDFEREITSILSAHNRRVPFASLPGLYWSYLKKSFPLCEKGELLVNTLSNKAQLCILGTQANQAIFYRRPKSEKDKKIPLDSFHSDIVHLLKVSPGFYVPLSKLIPLYHQYFGRQCCVADYGYKDLLDLLNALSNVVKIKEQPEMTILTFTEQFNQSLLCNDLVHLLEARGKHKLPVASLITAYYRFYGQKMYFRNFGYLSLQALVSSLDKRFKVSGTGDGKVLVLCQQKVNEDYKFLRTFADEVASLIQNQPDKQLGLHNLSSEYYKCYGRQLKLAELGFNKLTDLVAAISDFVEIRGSRDQKILYISDDHPNVDALWSEIEFLLATLTDNAVLVLQLSEIYADKLKKPFPLDTVKLNQFFKKVPENVLSIGKGSHRILIENNYKCYSSKLLAERIVKILYSCDHFKTSILTILDVLTKANIYVTVDRVSEEMSKYDYFQETKDHLLQLTPSISRKLFEDDIINLLRQQPNNQILLNHFSKTHSKTFGRVLHVSDYDAAKLQDLLNYLSPGIVEVTNNSVKLGKLGALYFRCKSVLEESDGALLLCNFAPEYQRMFKKPLKQSEYGFQKISDLVDCFSTIFKVYGEKNLKVVVLKDSIFNCNHKTVMQNEAMLESSNINEDNDSDVVVESEEFENDISITTCATDSIDLLQFTDMDDGKQSDTDVLEWWMEPVPDLPQPALEPELNQQQVSFDLISFTEFDDEELLNGGLDKSIPTNVPANPFSYYNNFANSDSTSNDFINDIFGAAKPADEPDLMRMLVGRCSPVDSFALPRTGGMMQRQESSMTNTLSPVSDTYSCFSALENIERSNSNRNSYSAALDDIFSSQLNLDVKPKPTRPKIAAKFSKQ